MFAKGVELLPSIFLGRNMGAVFCLLAAVGTPADAAQMLPVPATQAYCGNTDAYC